jgi:hypothetical protein
MKLVIWATLSLVLLAILFPVPEHYYWFEGNVWDRAMGSSGWQKQNPPAKNDRQFLFDLDFHGRKRPNFVRMAGESIAALLIGGGLAFAIRSPR